MKIKTLKGLALQDILTEVHLYVHRGQSINIWLWFVFIRILFFAFENMKCSKCILYVAFPNTHTFHAASSVQKKSCPVALGHWIFQFGYDGFNSSLA